MILILFLSTIYSWGPLTHSAHFKVVIDVIKEPYKSIITRNEYEFLYGCVFPDFHYVWLFGAPSVEIYQKVMKIKNEVGNWTHDHRFGFKLIKNASDEKELAFSIGYIVHLAGDVVQSEKFPEEWIAEFSQHRGLVNRLNGSLNNRGRGVLDFFYDSMVGFGIPFDKSEFTKLVSHWEKALKSELLLIKIFGGSNLMDLKEYYELAARMVNASLKNKEAVEAFDYRSMLLKFNH